MDNPLMYALSGKSGSRLRSNACRSMSSAHAAATVIAICDGERLKPNQAVPIVA